MGAWWRRRQQRRRTRRDTRMDGTCPDCGIYLAAHRIVGHGPRPVYGQPWVWHGWMDH